MLEIRSISKTYGNGKNAKQALDDVSFSAGAGQIVGLLGRNGAGKSSLLKILVGLLAATEGGASIGGIDIRSPHARTNLGYVPESVDFGSFTHARRFLAFCAAARGISRADIPRRVDSAMESFALGSAPAKISAFSKGMRRRLALAQALLHEPKLLLLDEPTDGLDPTERDRVADRLKQLKASGATVVLSSHVLPEVERVCDHVVILESGRIVHDAPAGDADLETVFRSVTGGINA